MIDEVTNAVQASPLDANKVLLACEAVEQKIIESGNGQALQMSDEASIMYSVYICAFMMEGRFPEARFLWKRIPQELKKTNDVQESWRIASSLMAKDWPTFFEMLERASLSDLVVVAMKELTKKVRAKSVSRLAKCYTSCDKDTLCKSLGMPGSEVSQFCASMGWELDASSGVIKIVNNLESRSGGDGHLDVNSDRTKDLTNAQLEHLAMHVAHLEASLSFKP